MKFASRKAIYLVAIVMLISALSLLAKNYFGDKQIINAATDNKASRYDTSKAVEKTLHSLSNNRSQAAIINGVMTEEKILSITFDDFTEEWVVESILELLEQHSTKATFFISGIKAAENSTLVKRIVDEGHEIGNYTLTGARKMEELSEVELAKDFSRAGVILKELTGESPKILKANSTEYTKEFLEVARAAGINSVVESTYILNYKSFSSYEMTLGYIGKINKGSVITVKLSGYLDDAEYEAVEQEEKPAIDKTSTIENENSGNNKAVLSEEEQLLQVIEWLLMAIDEASYRSELVSDLPYFHKENAYAVDNDKGLQPVGGGGSKPGNDTVKATDYNKLRQQNQGKTAKLINNMYTTQPAVAYVFKGVSNENTVNNILQILEEINAKSTFFVTGREILMYPDTIKSIVDKGHTLGNGGLGLNSKNPSQLSYEEISYEIEAGEAVLKNFLKEGYNSSNKYYMPLYADSNGFVLEAASALGYENVIMYNRNSILSRFKDTDVATILTEYYQNVISLHRGDIVYFRLDYLANETIEELVLKTAERLIKPAGYAIVAVDELVSNPLAYTPAARGIGFNRIKETYNFSKATLDRMIIDRYIGNPDIGTDESLKGFTPEEIDQIDKGGRIDTDGEKVIFLTFDDWGSDIIINKTLSVLDKYDAEASFFIRVGNDKLSYESDMPNPNLLRAIALEGHDIGNHTFTHRQINILEEGETNLIVRDIITAHNEMMRYIGDLEEFKPLFRPPTLAVSRLAMEVVFNMGYSHIINGDFSTKDYMAPSLDFLVNTMINGINIKDRDSGVAPDTPEEDIRRIAPGSIVVLHLSDESQYTPEALDIVIPYYMSLGYRFEKLSTYLDNDYKNPSRTNQ